MPLNVTPATPTSRSYQLFMLVLCVATLVGVSVQSMAEPREEVRDVLRTADTIACGLFFLDFLRSLYRAPDRLRYLYTWGWLDLISSIPVLDAARWGRVARIARLLGLLRGLRATAILAEVILLQRRKSAFLAASLTLLLLLVSASILILVVEDQPESNIRSAQDAIWWAVTTITTVGYGDRYPVTAEGRVVAAALMAAGVGVFGVLSGLLAAWFMEPTQAAEQREQGLDDLRALRTEVAELRALLEARRLTTDRPGPQADTTT